MSPTFNMVLMFGGFALGTAIACLVAFFLNRFDVFNTKVLGSVVSVIAGGVVTAFLGSGKEFAWVGYCLGLGVILLLFVVTGKLSVEVPKPIPMVHIAEVKREVRDSRLEMLDELHERVARGAIGRLEYNLLKGPILDDIKKNPAMVKPENKSVAQE